MTYDIQQFIGKCIICQEHGKSQPIIGTTQELPPFPWHTFTTDMFYWKRMDFLVVADVFSKYIIVRKLPNSTSAAICIELSMIVTELGLPHIIRSDNGPCYNSNEFQQFLQCYNMTHQTSSPNHPRSNGFVERMVGVAEKLMDKAGKEGKPWISGLFDYRVTPQSGSIASPLQLSSFVIISSYIRTLSAKMSQNITIFSTFMLLQYKICANFPPSVRQIIHLALQIQ